MDDVGLQQLCHRKANLSLEIVHYDLCQGFWIKILTFSFYIGNDNLVDIVKHGCFVGPVLCRVSNVPVRWKVVAGMATWF